MEGSSYARYKTTMLVAAGLFALWGILGIFDVSNLPYSGYATDGNNTITQVIDDGPAQQAGLQVGDYIRSTGGIAVEDAAAQLRRPRPGIGETREIAVERAGAQVSVDLTYTSLPARNSALTYVAILIGFCYLIFGLIPYLKAPRQRRLLFALFGLALGFSFFGGPYLSSYVLRTLFGVISTIMVTLGFAALLHFTLAWPKRKAFLKKRQALNLLYGPAALVSLFLIFRFVFNPAATSALNVITGVMIGLFILGYFGLSLAAFVHSYLKASTDERSANGLTYVLAGLLVGFLPVLVVVLVGLVAPTVVIPGGNFFFLTIVLIPISLALAVMKSDREEIEGYIHEESVSARVSFSS